ncbi:hypothetical protein E2C01_037390 [Portunus trituberculatus]|uniref:Uncharacterized protein n=1 Tax=Portunus trituberculatus TaxID=210409 RepID=A0A5B7FFH5_PORTR|nr:hypothetical protein [Portunus trituberculatus]
MKDCWQTANEAREEWSSHISASCGTLWRGLKLRLALSLKMWLGQIAYKQTNRTN